MYPVIAVVGRPNVGKSTLFNRLTDSRNALTADQPGVTRDRQYGHGRFDDCHFILVDTAGLDDTGGCLPEITQSMVKQTCQAIEEADIVIWILDGREGLTTTDEKLTVRLRQYSNKIYLAVNKTEGMDPAIVISEFHALGMGQPYPISAVRGSGLETLFDRIRRDHVFKGEINKNPDPGLRITIIGKPNVGKSTLINRIIGEDRLLTMDQPGTTRDTIEIPFQHNDHNYILIDTAGIRRRSKISDSIEKQSVIKSIRAIDATEIVILVLDAQSGIADQDANLLGMAMESGKALIIAVNKWDGLEMSDKTRVRNMLDRKLGFVDYALIHYISALHGSGVGNLFKSVNRIAGSLKVAPSTSLLNRILIDAVNQHSPPAIRGRRIKLRYVHVGSRNPFKLIIHGNQLQELPDSYRRYLSGYFRKSLKLAGIPVLIDLKQTENPYQNKAGRVSRGKPGRHKKTGQIRK